MDKENFIVSIRLDGEIWRDVKGYEGYYIVSSLGRIASLWKHIIMHPLTLRSKKCRYFSVLLHGNHIIERKLLHRLVAEAFLPNPENYPEVDHINRDGQDNRVENLRWCNRKMNMANEKTMQILSICHDGHDGSYRWRPIIQMKNGEIIKSFKNITEAESEGFRGSNITRVCRGYRKSHGGFQWAYADKKNKE